MQGSTRKLLGGILAAAVSCGGLAIARAQDGALPDPGYDRWADPTGAMPAGREVLAQVYPDLNNFRRDDLGGTAPTRAASGARGPIMPGQAVSDEIVSLGNAYNELDARLSALEASGVAMRGIPAGAHEAPVHGYVRFGGYYEPLGLEENIGGEYERLSGDQGIDVVGPGVWAPRDELEGELERIKRQAAAEKRRAAGVMSVKPEGRIYLDWTTFDQDASNKSPAQFGDAQNTLRARMARIALTGSGFEVIDDEIEVDFGPSFSGGVTGHVVKDLYVAVKELPLLGRVTVGHHKEPFSLEGQTSSRFTTFAERTMSNAVTALNPDRNVGISAGNACFSRRGTWAIGAFISDLGDRTPFLADDHLGTAVTMRYTLLPWYDEATEGRGLLHLGTSYSWRDQIRSAAPDFQARANTDVGPLVVDTPDLGPSDDRQLLNFEMALVYGPLSFQAEYFGAFVDRIGAADVDFHGAFAQVSCFLTGEHRPYLPAKGYFGRIRPFENFFRLRGQDCGINTGTGAWEVAYRYDWIDLNDAGVAGGAAGTHTLGLNWYLTPYTRVVWNLIHADCHPDQTSDPTRSELNAFVMRAQVDF